MVRSGALARLTVVLLLLVTGLPPSLARAGDAYVALGDSFSSGEGVDPYFRDGFDENGVQTGAVDNRCHRSTRAYATQVRVPGASRSIYEAVSGPSSPGTGKRVNKFGSDLNARSDGDSRWAFLACASATTSNVRGDGGTGQFAEPTTQAASPELEDATLVTITIGGNDVGFSQVLAKCAQEACNTSAFRAELERRVEAVRANLDQAFADVSSRAGAEATIVALGYPALFPATKEEQRCAKLRPWRGEQDMLRRAGSRLNAKIALAATFRGLRYVDVSERFAGHEVCGANGEWINGPSFTGKPGRKFLDDESFHPTIAGQRAYADTVNTELRRIARTTVRFPIYPTAWRGAPRTWDSSSPPGERPTSLKIGSGTTWTSLVWRSWGGQAAVARGRFADHPGISGGISTTGTVTLSKPRKCGRYRLYTRMDVRYDRDRPSWDDGQPILLDEGCY